MNGIQQPKPDPKGKAVASFMLGVISLLINSIYLAFLIPVMPLELCRNTWCVIVATINRGAGGILFPISQAIGDFLLLSLLFLPGLIGLILGIKGFKSSKRNLAKAGIALCIISLLAQILALLIVIMLILFTAGAH